MPRPRMNFDGFFRPFMESPYPESNEDSEDEPDHRLALAAMKRALPTDAVLLGTIGETISDRPGFDWRVEEHFYLLPAAEDGFEWALIRITWNDNDGCYEWAGDAMGSGYGDARATGRALAAAMFERWDFDLEGEEYEPYLRFLEKLAD